MEEEEMVADSVAIHINSRDFRIFKTCAIFTKISVPPKAPRVHSRATLSLGDAMRAWRRGVLYGITWVDFLKPKNSIKVWLATCVDSE
jgi:hypothetical protein